MTWSVGMITPGKELMCAIDMERLGITAYMPLGTRLTKPKGKRKPVRTYFFPFPGYIFIKDVRYHSMQMKMVRGFRRILFDRIHDSHVNNVKLKQNTGAFDVDDERTQRKRFKKGEQVRIIIGPLVGERAIVERDTSGNYWAFLNVKNMRVKIFVDFIERMDVNS